MKTEEGPHGGIHLVEAPRGYPGDSQPLQTRRLEIDRDGMTAIDKDPA